MEGVKAQTSRGFVTVGRLNSNVLALVLTDSIFHCIMKAERRKKSVLRLTERDEILPVQTFLQAHCAGEPLGTEKLTSEIL